MSCGIGILASVVLLAVLNCPLGATADDDVVLVQNPTDGQLAVVTIWLDEQSGTYKCRITSNPSVVEEVKKVTSDEEIFHPSADEMEMAKMECEETSRRKRRNVWAQDEESERMNFIFPGTKWCGSGDDAVNDDDLGKEVKTDKCCRAHDKCDDIMGAQETKHNLTNDSQFTSLSCKCDNKFYDCLRKVNDVTSNTVGNSYFNVLKRRCYEEDYPLTKNCKSRSKWTSSCLKYERDTTKPKVYQWKEAKSYNKLPLPSFLRF